MFFLKRKWGRKGIVCENSPSRWRLIWFGPIWADEISKVTRTERVLWVHTAGPVLVLWPCTFSTSPSLGLRTWVRTLLFRPTKVEKPFNTEHTSCKLYTPFLKVAFKWNCSMESGKISKVTIYLHTVLILATIYSVHVTVQNLCFLLLFGDRMDGGSEQVLVLIWA